MNFSFVLVDLLSLSTFQLTIHIFCYMISGYAFKNYSLTNADVLVWIEPYYGFARYRCRVNTSRHLYTAWFHNGTRIRLPFSPGDSDDEGNIFPWYGALFRILYNGDLIVDIKNSDWRGSYRCEVRTTLQTLTRSFHSFKLPSKQSRSDFNGRKRIPVFQTQIFSNPTT